MSMSRHAVANMADVGISKASAMKQHLQSIVPLCVIEDYSEMFLMNEADRLLAGSPDFALDRIDDVNSKAELLEYCLQHRCPSLLLWAPAAKSIQLNCALLPYPNALSIRRLRRSSGS